jgi:hypothetical protein
VADELIPGTLNAGHALPTIAQAITFVTAIDVAPSTLLPMVLEAALFTLKVIGMLPPGDDARGLGGMALLFAMAVDFALGALMTLGIGLYAP